MDKQLAIKKANKFREDGVDVHVVLNGTKRFYNGKISNIEEDYLDFVDRKQGKMVIFFEEIYLMEKYDG